jgi:hypothetical protein
MQIQFHSLGIQRQWKQHPFLPQSIQFTLMTQNHQQEPPHQRQMLVQIRSSHIIQVQIEIQIQSQSQFQIQIQIRMQQFESEIEQIQFHQLKIHSVTYLDPLLSYISEAYESVD